MSFYETPVRRLRIVRAIGLLLLAVVIGALSFAPDIDALGRSFCYVASGICLLASILNLWQSLYASPKQNVTLFPDRASVPEQIRFFRRMLWGGLFAFPAMSAFTFYDLHQLESGAAEQVHLWEPIALVYEHFGYWPAVLAPIVLGVVCGAVFAFKLRQLKTRAMTEDATLNAAEDESPTIIHL